MVGIASVPTNTCGGLNRWLPKNLCRNESLRPRAIYNGSADSVATIAYAARLSTSSKKCFLSGRSSASDSKTLAASPTLNGGDRRRTRRVDIRSAIASGARVVLRVGSPAGGHVALERASIETLLASACEHACRARAHGAVAPMMTTCRFDQVALRISWNVETIGQAVGSVETMLAECRPARHRIRPWLQGTLSHQANARVNDSLTPAGAGHGSSRRGRTGRDVDSELEKRAALALEGNPFGKLRERHALG